MIDLYSVAFNQICISLEQIAIGQTLHTYVDGFCMCIGYRYMESEKKNTVEQLYWQQWSGDYILADSFITTITQIARLTRVASYTTACSFFSLSIHLSSLFIPTPDKSLSTAATIAITAVLCLLVAFIAGTVCGALLTVCISRWNKNRHCSKPAPNTQEQQQTVAVYEEVDTQSKKIERKENVAYGPVKQSQEIELKENVAYGPVKQN